MADEVALQDESIARWRDAFRDDTTGINKTVQDLLRDYAAFRTVIKTVRLANEREGTDPPLNQMLFNLVSQGFWSSLLLGTRRLLDKGGSSGKKGVNSIWSVVQDVEASQDWLNRKIYVERVLHAQYDLDRLQQEAYDQVVAANGRAVWGDPELIKSDAAHRHFDALSGVSQSKRKPQDLISPLIFDKLKKRLADLDHISRHVSSHVAHAGNKQSRYDKELNAFDIRDARETLRRLKEIADLTGIWFANESSAGLATYIGDQFDGLDHAVVRTTDLVALAEQWRSIDRDIATWSIAPDDL
ncbi:hypothetical protein [Tardiphaga sp. 709]|uniref:AbiU2 domain-containing protein n=1 Tax=Tardiphaga sp. 709 TaxID=3076039 RepID=UPI0028EA17DC|nr:hypothetical protein [Tardiphaga sp. 709]WNV09789.1 hypothetical protein RSO67_00875 [Tardiphaga sp. 709]